MCFLCSLQLISHYDIVDINKLSSSLMIQFIAGPLNVPFDYTTNMSEQREKRENFWPWSYKAFIPFFSFTWFISSWWCRLEQMEWNCKQKRSEECYIRSHISLSFVSLISWTGEEIVWELGKKIQLLCVGRRWRCGGTSREDAVLRAQIMLVLNYIPIFLLSFLPHLTSLRFQKGYKQHFSFTWMIAAVVNGWIQYGESNHPSSVICVRMWSGACSTEREQQFTTEKNESVQL